MLNPLPWTAFEHDKVHFWVHYGLVAFGFLLAVITFVSQFTKPAPYGRHQKSNQSWGPLVHQRMAHTISDATPAVLVFSLVFFLYGIQRQYTNITFYCLWLCHYIHRGLIHPWIMKYSSEKTPLGIPIANIFVNLLYSFLNADWIGAAAYDSGYYKDPRFIIGIVIFLTGYIINRYADITLIKLRSNNSGYSVPHGCLFNIISCPNYFGEMVQWFGWALGTWSLAGTVWWLFTCATFVPRARHNHQWYKEQFPDYPENRKALIPFLY